MLHSNEKRKNIKGCKFSCTGSYIDCSTTVPCSSMKPFGIFLSTDVTRAFLWFLNLYKTQKYCEYLMEIT